MEDFEKNTINPDFFQIDNVENDNACFYRALANYTYFATPHDKLNLLKRFYGWGKTKDIDRVIEKYGRYSNDQDQLARFLQRKIVKYIENNPQEIIPQTGMTIEDSIQLIHNISFEEYLSYYKEFAGDINIDDELDETDSYIDRWGSIIEQYVISKIISCPIYVYNSQKYDKKYNKIVNGKIIKNKPEKNVRLRLTSIIGQEYIGHKMPIFLLWREYHNNGHYLVCYPKNISDISSIIQQ